MCIRPGRSQCTGKNSKRKGEYYNLPPDNSKDIFFKIFQVHEIGPK